MSDDYEESLGLSDDDLQALADCCQTDEELKDVLEALVDIVNEDVKEGTNYGWGSIPR